MQGGAAITTPLLQGPFVINRKLLRPYSHKLFATAAVLSYLFASCSAIFNPKSSPAGLALYFTACTLGIMASLFVISAPERKSEDAVKSCSDIILRSITPPLTKYFKNGDARRFLAFTNFANHAILYFGHSLMERELAWFEGMLFAASALSNAFLTLPKRNEIGYMTYSICTGGISISLFALNVSENNFPAAILACANFTTIAASLFSLIANIPSCSEVGRSYDQVANSSAQNGSMYV